MAVLRLFLCGMPKSGTTTIHKAMQSVCLMSAHHRDPVSGGYLADLMWEPYRHGLDPLVHLKHVEAVTEHARTDGQPLWPFLDMGFLMSVARHHPDCLMLLQTRHSSEIVRSIDHWKDLRARITAASLPGLPVGVGGEDHHLAKWVRKHYERVRETFAGYRNFMEVDIADPQAREKIFGRLGLTPGWWGVAKRGEWRDEATEERPSA